MLRANMGLSDFIPRNYRLSQSIHQLFRQAKGKRHPGAPYPIDHIYIGFGREEEVRLSVRQLRIDSVPGLGHRPVPETGELPQVAEDLAVYEILVKWIVSKPIFVGISYGELATSVLRHHDMDAPLQVVRHLLRIPLVQRGQRSCR